MSKVRKKEEQDEEGRRDEESRLSRTGQGSLTRTLAEFTRLPGAIALEPPIPSPMDVSSVQPCRHVAQPTPARVIKNPKPIPPGHLGSVTHS